MAKISGAEAMVRMLDSYKVEYLFGLCGDTSLPFYDALFRIPHSIRHILCRDERSAAYMADAYSRISGKPGICEGPSGGGATYILPGLIEANDSSSAVLAITSDIAIGSEGKFALTDLDQVSLFKPVTDWNTRINLARQVPSKMRRAFREMTRNKPSAVHVCFPIDMQKEREIEETDLFAEESDCQYPAQRQQCDPGQIELGARLLNRSSNTVLVCGGGGMISQAFQEIQQLAETLAAPVATSISGKGIISELHGLSLGVVGSNGSVPELRKIFDHADLVFFIGCRAGSVLTEKWQYPKNHEKTILHLDIDGNVPGANYKTACSLTGDAKLAIRQLLPLLEKKPETRLEKTKRLVADLKREKFECFQKLAQIQGDLIKPEMLVRCLNELLSEDSIVVADAGTPCPYLSAYYTLKRAGRYFISNRAHGALGYALSAAAGAQFAAPGQKCVGIMGDGSFGFTSGELETVVRYNLPITFIVVSNKVYGWIKAGQKTQFDKRYFSVDFSGTNHAKIAEAYGLKAVQVSKPAELKQALQTCLEFQGPSLVDVICQPLEEANAPVSEWIA